MLAEMDRISDFDFESPDGDRYGDVQEYFDGDLLIVKSWPKFGGDSKTFLIQCKNYKLKPVKKMFRCDASMLEVEFNGQITPIHNARNYEGRVIITLKDSATPARLKFTGLGFLLSLL